MSRSSRLFALTVVLACMGAMQGEALAQARPVFVVSGAAGARPLSTDQKQDRQFLRETAAHLRFQREASKLAMDKSSSPRVRTVAAALLNHTSTTQPEVQHLLHARGMAMPMLGNDETRLLKALRAQAGVKFDRLWIEQVALRPSQLDAVAYERMLGVTRDAQLRGWIERHLPAVRQHLALAGAAPS